MSDPDATYYALKRAAAKWGSDLRRPRADPYYIDKLAAQGWEAFDMMVRYGARRTYTENGLPITEWPEMEKCQHTEWDADCTFCAFLAGGPTRPYGPDPRVLFAMVDKTPRTLRHCRHGKPFYGSAPRTYCEPCRSWGPIHAWPVRVVAQALGWAGYRRVPDPMRWRGYDYRAWHPVIDRVTRAIWTLHRHITTQWVNS